MVRLRERGHAEIGLGCAVQHVIFLLVVRVCVQFSVLAAQPERPPQMASIHDSTRISKPARRAQTCDTCKARHQKCNGARPKCTNCELRSLNFSYGGLRSTKSGSIPSNEPSHITSTLLLVLPPQVLRGLLIAVIETRRVVGWPSQTTSMLAYGTGS